MKKKKKKFHQILPALTITQQLLVQFHHHKRKRKKEIPFQLNLHQLLDPAPSQPSPWASWSQQWSRPRLSEDLPFASSSSLSSSSKGFSLWKMQHFLELFLLRNSLSTVPSFHVTFFFFFFFLGFNFNTSVSSCCGWGDGDEDDGVMVRVRVWVGVKDDDDGANCLVALAIVVCVCVRERKFWSEKPILKDDLRTLFQIDPENPKLQIW